jgi:acetate kinase
MHKDGYSIDEAFNVLNKRSGILGISGLTNDMRDLLEEEQEHKDRRATLAIDMFCGRIKKYVGAYLAEMNGADAIAFTGGIGENAPIIRKRCLSNMENLGIIIDDEKNNNAPRGGEAKISADNSKISVWVLPTNEELILARDTCRVVLNALTF